MKKYLLMALCLLPILFISFISVYAQIDDRVLNIDSVPEEERFFSRQDNSENSQVSGCYDYYNSQNIQIDMEGSSLNAVAGMDLDFRVNIENKNEYPITNSIVYAKIFKMSDNNDYYEINQFVVNNDIFILSKQFFTLDSKWKIPSNQPTGNYRIAIYLINEKLFNLQGFSLNSNLFMANYDFKIVGAKEEVLFDRDEIFINDSKYSFEGNNLILKKDSPIQINSLIQNISDSNQGVDITWKIYKNSNLIESNLLQTKKEYISIEPNSDVSVDLKIDDINFGKYFVVGEITYKDVKDKVNLLISKDGLMDPQVVFSTIINDPFNKTVDVLSCFDNDYLSNDYNVSLELLDKDGKILSQKTFENIKIFKDMGLKQSFNKNSGVFSIRTVINEKNNNLVDQLLINYDCKNSSSTTCQKKYINWSQLSILFLVLIIFIIIYVLINKNKKSIPKLIIVFAVCLSSYSVVNYVEAKSISPNINPSGIFSFAHESKNNVWAPSFISPNITIKYDTQISDPTGKIINDGDSVSVNDNLIVKFLPHKETDISWFAKIPIIGKNYSAPSWSWYPKLMNSKTLGGEWRQNATSPGSACREKDFFTLIFDDWVQGNLTNPGNHGSGIGYFKTYSIIVLNPPNKTLRTTSGIECGSLSGNELNGFEANCVVKTQGTQEINFDFSSTYGKKYFRYFDLDTNPAYYGCKINNTPIRKANRILPGCKYWFYCAFQIEPQEYRLDIPQQNIKYVFNSMPQSETNKPPLPPTITGNQTTTVGTSSSYSFVATDPDNDKIRYEIDWSNPSDDTPDQNLPSFDLTNSGTSLSTNFSFGSLPYTFKARTVDEHNATSTWSSFTVTNQPTSSISCGTNAQIYKSASSTWPSGGTFCTEPAYVIGGGTPNFPDPGLGVRWSCTDGTNGLVCTASRENQDIDDDPSCGYLSGRINLSEWPSTIGPDGLCRNTTIHSRGVTENSVGWEWGCDGVGDVCRATRTNVLTEIPKISLKIQPKLTPNCVVRLIEESSNTSSNPDVGQYFKSEKTCKITKGGNNIFTINLLNYQSYLEGTASPIQVQGLYTLSCENAEGIFAPINTDTCILNPGVIEQ